MSDMILDKQSIISSTNNGLSVFKHFLGSRFVKLGKSFKSPFYNDTKAACYIYRDRKNGMYKFKDFGNSEYSGDCFFFVSKIYNLNCNEKEDFKKVMEIINDDLGLGLAKQYHTVEKFNHKTSGKVINASELTSIHNGFDTAKGNMPIKTKQFNESELSFWRKYGITKPILDLFNVVAVESFKGIGKSGKEYTLISSFEEPIYGYQGRKHTKLYRPFSKLRFLYTGELTESYIFGYDQMPIRGDTIFITGGEKDVMSLYSHGLNAISMNSETANIPKNLLRGLSYRFKHIVLLYDCDKTGIESMKKLCNDHKSFGIKSLELPLSGEKGKKDISDFFAMGNSAEDLKMLFLEMLDGFYEETISIMKSCEIDFSKPPIAPEPLIAINDVTIGTPGNIMCVAGTEGSGKTNFLGGIISGALKPEYIEIDTLGTMVRENVGEKAILLYDTEQSEFQLYKNLSYILKRSTREVPPSWFKAYCLVGISRGERMKMILESMDKFFYEFGGIHMVIIDGIADLLGGVNDEESSVALIEELFRLSAIYNTVIISVLHMTPSGMKLRGHLGSEVQRKAAGILLIEKDDNKNTSSVKALKVRDGSPFDVPIIEFGWSKEEGRHVYIGEKSKEDANTRKLTELSEVAKELFEKHPVIFNATLIQNLMDTLDIKDRMARNYVKFMKDNGIIEKSNQMPGAFRLV